MAEDIRAESAAEAPKLDASVVFWARVREHKIIQWGLAYLGSALALAHGQELLAHAFHWPDVLGRIFMIVLIAGLPIALTLAWYHGHRGLTRIGAGELTIISLLLVIGAAFFTVALRPAEHASANAATPTAGERSTRAALVASNPLETRLDVTTPETTRSSSFALSPDGRSIVFSAAGPGGEQLWVRSLHSTLPRPIAGTEGGVYPFWSPDGRSIGFFTINALKRVAIDGSEAQSLAAVLTPGGGTWNADGTILYVPNASRGVFRISATGGDSTPVTQGFATRLPQFLPDGRHFLFYASGEEETAGVYVGDLQSDDVARLLAADAPAAFGSGYVWFVRDDTLFAQQLDPITRTLGGDVHPIADDVGIDLNAPVSASAAGPVAYRSGRRHLRQQLAWFDRSGAALGIAGEEGMQVRDPSLSLDDRYVVVQRAVRQNLDIWLLELERNIFTRLTNAPEIESLPLWSPDRSRVVFNSAVGGRQGLAIKVVDGTAPDELLLPTTDFASASDWSPDGRYILYTQFDGANSADLWALTLDADRTRIQLTSTRYVERDGQFSPDGRQIAFESNESGTPEIYVQPFPRPGAKVRISTNGGRQVRWRRDGAELFYIALDNTLMSVPMGPTTGPSGVGTPVRLFTTRVPAPIVVMRQQYVVTADGQRFLMVSRDEAPTPPITLLSNWTPPAP